MQSREMRLKNRPVGEPTAADFELATTETGDPGPGQVLVRNLWMSVDPYMRGRMYDRESYVPPFKIGEALQGGAVGEVVASKAEGFAKGDRVVSMFGWREAYIAPAQALEKLPADNMPPQAYLGVLGMPGLTAYSGLLAIGEPKPGDTVFVSGAAGAVGSLVCQIAKIKGCTVVASAGTEEKLAWLKGRGVDQTINYRTAGNLVEALRAAAPRGIDIYFDNVGGDHLEAALEVARNGARFIECGMISQYNDTQPRPGPRNLVYLISKSMKMEGYVVTKFASMRPQFLADMAGWIREGKVKWEETVFDGIDKSGEAFISLFSGANTGKMLVRLG